MRSLKGSLLDNSNFWIFSTRFIELFYKGLGLLFKVLIFLVFFYFIYGFFVPQAKEDVFLDKVAAAFVKGDTHRVLVKDITDFEWDRVCAFENGFADDPFTILSAKLQGVPSSALDIRALYAERSGYDKSVFDHNVPEYGWTYFNGAHFFFLDGQIVKTFIYRGWGGLIGFEINDNFVMVDYIMSDHKGCEDKKDAVFEYRDSDQEGHMSGLYLTRISEDIENK